LNKGKDSSSENVCPKNIMELKGITRDIKRDTKRENVCPRGYFRIL
jgi:hypothetical protein